MLRVASWLLVLFMFLVLASTAGLAQTGRGFVSIEAYVGMARIVYVGKIIELEKIEYTEPNSRLKQGCEPYWLAFEVSETIRGDELELLEIVISLRSPVYFEYLRDNAAEILLAAAPDQIDRSSIAEIGIEEQGKRLDDQWYHFRLLTQVNETNTRYQESLAPQLARIYDSFRMFNSQFNVVQGRKVILKRARAFAKEHSAILPTVWIRIPNEFAALCGPPGAYSAIKLPVCPSTNQTLLKIKENPNLIMDRIECSREEFEREQMLKSIDKALAEFPIGDHP